MRPQDRERVEEICADVWEGEDYIPAVFDRWVTDPGATFQAAELDSHVIGLQRLRPLSPELLWYEGLRVAAPYRGRGIGRAMVGEAQAEAGRLGFREMRLAAGDAAGFFSRLGFETLVDAVRWGALRMEGGEPPPLARPADAEAIWSRLREDGALAAYAGVNADTQAALDLNREELGRLVDAGSVRTLAGGRALAVVRPSAGGKRLSATFLSGSGVVLTDLLLGLRYEADADGRTGVALLVPEGHPGTEAMAAAGFEPELGQSDRPIHFYIQRAKLP